MGKRICAILLLCVSLVMLLASCTRAAKEADLSGVRFRNLTWAVSTPLPKPQDFAENLPAGYSVSFAKKYTFQQLGEYSIDLIVTDPEGGESRRTVKLMLVLDEEAPTVTGLKDLSVVLGGTVSYLSGVKTQDNCDGAVTLTVDSSNVNLRQEGVYNVYYIATDAVGNSVTYPLRVTVYRQTVTREMLWEELDPIIGRILSDGMSTVEKLKEIYNYVHDNVAYVATSEKSDWIHAAYEGLTTRRGDCYTYFALSKAFFERLGIGNLDVRRDTALSVLANERHFWNMVNVGSEQEPLWYHFDACRMRDLAKPWGCLMTDDQLADYTAQKVSSNGVKNYFYAFDTSLYPATPTQKLNTDY